MTNPDWTTFCCVLIERKVFEDTGLLDERFKFTFEDVDFCIRAKKAGFNIELINDEVYHKVSLKPRLSLFRLYWKIRGGYLFFKKHKGSYFRYLINSLLNFRRK